MKSLDLKCFKCNTIHNVKLTTFHKKYPNQYLCVNCRKSDETLKNAYLEWKYLISNKSLCEDWKNKEKGFKNFYSWYLKNIDKNKPFLCRYITKEPYGPKNCYYSDWPSDEIIFDLLKKHSRILYRCNTLHDFDRHYDYYKGKNISVCDEWNSSKYGKINFIQWAINNGYKPYLTLDRIDSNKGYSPDNCRWVDYYEQNKNRSIYKTNTSGYTGVRWYEKRNAYFAYIHYDYNIYPIGYFETPYDASIAYDMFIIKNDLDKPLNNKHLSKEELEKEFNKVVIRTFLFNRKKFIRNIKKKKNYKSYMIYYGINMSYNNYLNIFMRILDFKVTIPTKLKIPVKAAIVRDYLILKYNLPLKKLIHLDLDKRKREKCNVGFLLNFPRVLFDEATKRHLFKIAERIIESGVISENALKKLEDFLKNQE